MRKGWPVAKGYHWDVAKPVVHPANGRNSCRWCKGEVKGKKKNWCDDPKCVESWKFRTQKKVFRSTVFDRDGGVCVDCGLDCAALDLDRLRSALWNAAEAARKGKVRADLSGPADALVAALDWRVLNNVPVKEPAWQVDHIVPLCEGGDAFDMDNLATVCVPCHRARSSKASRRRKEARAASRSNGRKKPKKATVKRKAGRR